MRIDTGSLRVQQKSIIPFPKPFNHNREAARIELVVSCQDRQNRGDVIAETSRGAATRSARIVVAGSPRCEQQSGNLLQEFTASGQGPPIIELDPKPSGQVA